MIRRPPRSTRAQYRRQRQMCIRDRARIATTDDPIARMLLNAGAEIPAKTLTSELGATCYAERDGVPVLESPAYPGCTPGGSSTGAGVAVAHSLVRSAHGTDAGGSVRVPAGACAVVGFKAASHQLAAHGFLTTGVADLFTITCLLYTSDAADDIALV